MNEFFYKLKKDYQKCSDGGMHDDYKSDLDILIKGELTEEIVCFLCEISTSKKHFWEFRLDNLKVLLLNESSLKYDLKEFYIKSAEKTRSLPLKLFFIRGYAMYATEKELIAVVESYLKSIEKNHEYADYEYILSVAGIPYLVNKYGYECFVKLLEKTQEEYLKIDISLRGFFTLDENFETVVLLSEDERERRQDEFFKKHNF